MAQTPQPIQCQCLTGISNDEISELCARLTYRWARVHLPWSIDLHILFVHALRSKEIAKSLYRNFASICAMHENALILEDYWAEDDEFAEDIITICSRADSTADLTDHVHRVIEDAEVLRDVEVANRVLNEMAREKLSMAKPIFNVFAMAYAHTLDMEEDDGTEEDDTEEDSPVSDYLEPCPTPGLFVEED
ncbi:hypothetical protein NA57DRAFT_71276 [Rhizodiscina lignyota]|uniref:Uncharacterized protein n=1 Tax=Rhizodiscina lignyota TaxID=1504668 RepID=A0A9P4IP59_9PEZI|nr:hypothetical protein NA57DRAFT_71276 [Rhizodiscina lignyota]